MEKTVIIFMMLAVFISLFALFFIVFSGLYLRKTGKDECEPEPLSDGQTSKKNKNKKS